MELYKWYKGDELPDREYDCVVVYHKRFQFYGTIETGTVIKKGFGKCVSDEGNYYIEDVYGGWILPKDIIAWMPIEFPKKVS